MAVKFPPLPFELTALEPHISARTIQFHYGKHHRAYVDTLNQLIQGTSLDRYSLEEIIQTTHQVQPQIFNNASQAWNHEFMWNCLTPELHPMSQAVTRSLERTFGSVEEFKNEFLKSSKELFGSGWTWLVLDKQGKLKIRALSDAENPMTNGEIPVFTCDIWEHAYYLDFQNSREKYLEAYWNLISWETLEANLEAPRPQYASSKRSDVTRP